MPGKSHENLDKNEGELVGSETCRSLVSQAMFYTTKLGSKLENSTRE